MKTNFKKPTSTATSKTRNFKRSKLKLNIHEPKIKIQHCNTKTIMRKTAHLGDVPEVLVPLPLVGLDLRRLQVAPNLLRALGKLATHSRFR